MQRAQAHLQKAQCHVKLNEYDAALTEFRASLDAERAFKNVQTNCWLEFPWFLVAHEMSDYYDEATTVHKEFRTDSKLAFPISRYQYSVVQAFLAAACGERDLAKAHAQAALKCAAENHSGFQYHPNLGLVDYIDPQIRSRLSKLIDE
ncbi:MAG: hypothetical protein WD851_21350 [Pirellulales bacterium]